MGSTPNDLLNKLDLNNAQFNKERAEAARIEKDKIIKLQE
jgi:hypothetical protein